MSHEPDDLYQELLSDVDAASTAQRAQDRQEATQHLICSESLPRVLRFVAMLKLIRAGVISLDEVIAAAEAHLEHSAEEEDE